MRFTGNQYSLLLLLFYIPNAIFDLPLNLLTKKFSGRIVLSSLCVGWGAMSMLQVVCKNFAGMLAVRLILGYVHCRNILHSKDLTMGGYMQGVRSGFLRRCYFHADSVLHPWRAWTADRVVLWERGGGCRV